VDAINLYLDSAEDLEMVSCFLNFHEIKEYPRKTQNPVMDLRVSEHPAQSASQNALSLKSEAARKTLVRNSFEISQDTIGCIKVWLPRRVHKLA
jgi:hypothetical protein